MRKMMLVTMIGLCSYGVQAQTRAHISTTSFGLTAGVNWNTLNGKTATGGDQDNQLKTGFHAGLNAEIPLGQGFYLQPGAEYRQKGAEFNNGDKLTLSYIDIPVNFIYKPALGGGNIILGFGPYVGFGINGELKSTGGSERKVQFNNTYSITDPAELQYKKLDAGANFLAGYAFGNRLSATLKAQLGLLDINPDSNIPEDETRLRNTGFGLSLGYRF